MENEIIYSYTRAEAIRDGVLIYVSEMAKEAGFIYPVAVTSRVWENCIAWDNDVEPVYQDELGRLWDIVSMMQRAAMRCPVPVMLFRFLRVPRGKSASELVELVAECIPMLMSV
ncbi:MAG TPA: hypothetical protein PLV42_05420 [bacterium]|nr:hypothetical protein [bacterium]